MAHTQNYQIYHPSIKTKPKKEVIFGKAQTNRTDPPEKRWDSPVIDIKEDYNAVKFSDISNGVHIARSLIDKFGIRFKFDTIAFTGYSGATVGSILAHELGKDITIVRKKYDSLNQDTCHGMPIEGRIVGNCIILDDFFSSGSTLIRISNEILNNTWLSIVAVVLHKERSSFYEGTAKYIRDEVSKMKDVPFLYLEDGKLKAY